MKASNLHDWHMSPAEAVQVQRELADRVSTQGDEPEDVRLIAGIDVSVPRGGKIGRGAVVVLSYPGLEVVEIRTAERVLAFPYIPGLLSFREVPVILDACRQLTGVPDLIFVDGQGYAHPRRVGLASHLGLLWDRPTIGCAKSRLCGEHGPVGTDRGDSAILIDGGETIGTVLRTRSNVKPIFVSTGHKISLETAVDWVLRCCRGFRLPEPTRLAHQAAGGHLKLER